MRPLTLKKPPPKEAHFRDRDVFVFRDPKGKVADSAPDAGWEDGVDRSSDRPLAPAALRPECVAAPDSPRRLFPIEFLRGLAFLLVLSIEMLPRISYLARLR